MLISDPVVVERDFEAWVDALRPAGPVNDSWWIDDAAVAVRLKRNPDHRTLRKIFLSTARDMKHTIEVNLPSRPGDANALSAVADGPGGRWLLRQGWSRALGTMNVESGSRAFAALSGLMAVPTVVSSGPTDRLWYQIAPLHSRTEEIRRWTATFVRAHEFVRSELTSRDLNSSYQSPGEERARQLADELENAASFTIPARDAQTADRPHARIINEFARQLRLRHIDYHRPKHIYGYEADLVVVAESNSILLEIKTSTSASDIHSGVGQLLIYRQIFPALRDHAPVLMLPGDPPMTLAHALNNLGIVPVRYDWQSDANGDLILDFRATFAQLNLPAS